jgi:YD repeat-containing protein
MREIYWNLSPMGEGSQFEYDAIGRLTRWTDPDETMSYQTRRTYLFF